MISDWHTRHGADRRGSLQFGFEGLQVGWAELVQSRDHARLLKVTHRFASLLSTRQPGLRAAAWCLSHAERYAITPWPLRAAAPSSPPAVRLVIGRVCTARQTAAPAGAPAR